MTRLSWLRAVLVLLLAGVLSAGAVASWVDYRCVGVEEDGLCWLRDPRLRSYVTWTLEDVPSGANLFLQLDAVGHDTCEGCLGRDVELFVYLREPGATEWHRLDVTLRNTARDCGLYGYPLRAVVPFYWEGPGRTGSMIVRIQRALLCDPYVGFHGASVSLGRPAAPEPPPAPPPPEPPPPPEEPPPPPPPPPPPEEPVEECVLPPDEGCWPGDIPDLCPVWDPYDVTVRERLPDTTGPGDAPLLGPGHYEGSLGTVGPRGQLDRRDWYRIDTRVGESLAIWFEADPTLTYDVYIVDVCGIVHYRLTEASGTIYCVAPCTQPISADICGWYIHIVRRAGQGEYRMSLFTADF